MMGSYIYSIVCASVFVFIILSLSPDGEKGKMGKYIGFIGSLVIMMTILSPIPGLIRDIPGDTVGEIAQPDERDTSSDIGSYYARTAAMALEEIYNTGAAKITARVTTGDEGEIRLIELFVNEKISYSAEEAGDILSEILGITIQVKEGKGG